MVRTQLIPWSGCVVVLLALSIVTPVVAQNAADVAWEAGDHTTAERLYLEQLETDPTNRTALHRVALIHAWSERFQSSIDYFDRLIALNPNNAEVEIERARVLGWAKRYDEAMASLEDLIKRAPDNLEAMRLRAQIAGWAGELKEAIATYDRILELIPGDTDVSRNRARTLTWASRHDEALAIYERLLEETPDDRETLLGIAQLLAWSGRLDSAGSIYERMLVASPNDLAALRGRARVASWSGELGKGEDYWRAILDSSPEDVEALVGLSQTLRWQGRNGTALDVLKRAKQIDPTNAEVLSQERWTRASISPRVTGTVTYEGDSDGNRILTSSIRTAFSPVSRVDVTGNGYSRRAGFDSRFLPKRTSLGISGTVRTQFEPGWSVSITAGVSESNALGAEPIGTVQLAFNSPLRDRVAINAGFVRTAFDYTAPLMEQGVYFKEFRAGARLLLPRRTTLSTTLAHATFEGTSRNHRTQSLTSLTKRLTNPITVGANLRVFGFTEDLNDGYFDPNFYSLLEATGRWQQTYGQNLTLHAELAPGLQKIRTGGSFGATVRAVAGATFGVLPGRQLSIQGVYASTGIQSFSTSPGTYRYRAITLSGGWRF